LTGVARYTARRRSDLGLHTLCATFVAPLWWTTKKRKQSLQCESKKSPLRFSDSFSQTVGNF